VNVIDEKGRLFGKVSILDLLIVLAIIGVGAGYVYRQISPRIAMIINANDVFYITLEVERQRAFNAHAVAPGDVMFRQHDNQPLGTVVSVDLVPATNIMHRIDGTALIVETEYRYTAYITLESIGTITNRGHFVNGTTLMAPGRNVVLMSNRVIMPNARVYSVSQDMPGEYVVSE